MMAKWLGGGRSRRRGKKVGAALAAGVVALAVLAGCGTASESGKDGGRTHISLGSAAPGIAAQLPVVYGQEHGVFVDHGLDLEVVSVGDSAAAVSAVLSGSVDVMYGGLTTVASAKEAGHDLVMFCGNLPTSTTYLVAKSGGESAKPFRGFATWQEAIRSLKGKSVGVPGLGSGPHLSFEAAASLAGLAEGDITFIPVSQDAAVASLNQGQVDLTVINAFSMQNERAKGTIDLVSVLADDVPPFDVNGGGYAAKISWLEHNPDTAKAFCDAMQGTYDAVKDPANADQIKKMLFDEYGLVNDPAAVESALHYLTLFSTEITPDPVNNSLTALYDAKVLTSKLTYDDVVHRLG
ncbi:ABC transporter substrate-binding protein [Granulicoccus phenolivorans]|uniref:ABC transporter substrate-binding protein n=2 Tax=Granulicoccus phenolivorans TaxID=266854 RepID=UPI0009DB9CE9|nr:ABC transporter substrate-binding protein [Granulicoccus phenolivorans]